MSIGLIPLGLLRVGIPANPGSGSGTGAGMQEFKLDAGSGAA